MLCSGFMRGKNTQQREQMNWRELFTNLHTSCRRALEQKKPDLRGYAARNPIGIKFKQLRRFYGVRSQEGGPSFGG